MCEAMSDEFDFDVEAEITRELAALADGANISFSLESSGGSESRQQAADGDVLEPASLAALRAAMQAQEQLADKLASTLQEVQHLCAPQQLQQQTQEHNASSDSVAAAVAALSQLVDSGSSKVLGSTAVTPTQDAQNSDTAAATDGTHEIEAAFGSTADSNEALADTTISLATDHRAEEQIPNRVGPPPVQAEALPLQHVKVAVGQKTERVSAPATLATAMQPAVQKQAELCSTEPLPSPKPSGWFKNAVGKIITKFHTAVSRSLHESPVAAGMQHAAVLLNTEGRNSRIAAQPAATKVHAAVDIIAAEAEVTAAAPDAGAEAESDAAARAASNARVQLVAEQAAAAAAHEQFLADQVALQRVMEEQAVAAKARAAAQAARLQELRQQAEAAACRYMSAWRIARVWQAYKRSPARAARLHAVIILQAALRGLAARRLLQHLTQRQEVLVELTAALQQGHSDVIQAVASRAEHAGVGAEAEQLVSLYNATVSTAAQHLQQAAERGNHAAFKTAAAAASRHASLQETLATCTAQFEIRRGAAEQALAAAVTALPLVQVQGAVDVALQLGVPGKQLAAALKAARARDSATAARLAAAVKAAAAGVQLARKLAATWMSRSASVDESAAGVETAEQASAAADSVNSRSCTSDSAADDAAEETSAATYDFQLAEFDAAAALCQKLGVSCDIAAARCALEQHRQAVAGQLAAAALHSPSAAAVQQLISLCQAFGGLDQQVQAAQARLQVRQAQLAQQLEKQLGLQTTTATSQGNCDLAQSSSMQAGYAEAKVLLQQARQLGVPVEQVAAAEQHMQAMQHAAAAQVQQAAATGSIDALKQAMVAARRHGVDEQILQQCQQQMQQRRADAAIKLAAAAQQCCSAVAAWPSGKSCAVLQDMLSLVQQAQSVCKLPIARSGHDASMQLLTPWIVGHSEQLLSATSTANDCADAAFKGTMSLDHLRQQLQTCLSSGLVTNVKMALEAIETACRVALHQCNQVVVACTLDLAGSSAGRDSSSMSGAPFAPEESWCVTSPEADTCDDAEIPEQQQHCGDDTGSSEDSKHQQQLPGLAWAVGSAGMCAAVYLAASCKPAVVRIQPVQHLQQRWAQHLQAAAAAEARAGLEQHWLTTQCNCNASSNNRLAITGLASAASQSSTACNKQQYKQQRKESDRLQQLLAANAAVPVGQLAGLRQLDLSLEQLHELQGLDQLCPQLTGLAANMNRLSSLVGLQGCKHLRELSAKDNGLTQLPDITSHPNLKQLSLNNNQIKHLGAWHNASIIGSRSNRTSSANSMGQQLDAQQQLHQHSLHVLSLTNNQLNTLLLTTQTDSSSSNSSISYSSSKNLWLRSWLVGLQVLNVSGNQLRDLDGLQGCSSLRQLDVSRNKLTCIKGLLGCHVLQELNASGNLLSSVPAALHMPLLQQVDLASNNFSTWPSFPPLPHLQRLSFADNQLQSVQPLDDLLQLRELNLGFNQLTDLHACLACLTGASNLLQLQLHDNPCCAVPAQDEQNWEDGVQQRLGQAQAIQSISGSMYREQVAAAMPWLLQLDREDLHPSQRAEQSVAWQAAAAVASSRSASGCSDSTAAAVGQYAASNVPLSVELVRRLRGARLSVGLPLPAVADNNQCGTSTAAGRADGLAVAGSRSQQAGCTCSAADASACAAFWLPCLVAASAWSLDGSKSQGAAIQQEEQQYGQQLCCSHLTTAAAAVNGSGWLENTDQHWCCSTRAMLVQQQAQQQQQQDKTPQNKPDTRETIEAQQQVCVDADQNVTRPGIAASFTALCTLHRHLNELCSQPCRQHQQLLLLNNDYVQQQQAVLCAAAQLLQCSWRARTVRQQYNLQLQQYRTEQALAAAAVPLQSMWRGRQACKLAALLLQQEQQQLSARHAAAARIQAAVRGFTVRQRLKAALAAASLDIAGSAAAVPKQPTASSSGCGTSNTAAAALADSWDEDDYSGVPDDFVTMPAALLQELHAEALGSSSSLMRLWPGSSSSSSNPANRRAAVSEQHAGAATHGGRSSFSALQVLTAAVSNSFEATAGAAASQQGLLPPAASVLASVPAHGETSVCDGPASQSIVEPDVEAATASRYEAKLQRLMQEWGFTDRATAEAYYKRQRHTQKAAAKHKLQQQLKDPAVRLHRLQEQLGTTPAVVSGGTKTCGSKFTTVKGALAKSLQRHSSLSSQQAQQSSSSSTSTSGSACCSKPSSNCSGGSSRVSKSGNAVAAASCTAESAWAVPDVLPTDRTDVCLDDDDRMSMHSFSSCGTTAGSGNSSASDIRARRATASMLPAREASTAPGALLHQGSSSFQLSTRQLKSSLSSGTIKQASLPVVVSVGNSASGSAGRISMGGLGNGGTAAGMRQVPAASNFVQQLPHLPPVRGAQ